MFLLFDWLNFYFHFTVIGQFLMKNKSCPWKPNDSTYNVSILPVLSFKTKYWFSIIRTLWYTDKPCWCTTMFQCALTQIIWDLTYTHFNIQTSILSYMIACEKCITDLHFRHTHNKHFNWIEVYQNVLIAEKNRLLIPCWDSLILLKLLNMLLPYLLCKVVFIYGLGSNHF